MEQDIYENLKKEGPSFASDDEFYQCASVLPQNERTELYRKRIGDIIRREVFVNKYSWT